MLSSLQLELASFETANDEIFKHMDMMQLINLPPDVYKNKTPETTQAFKKLKKLIKSRLAKIKSDDILSMSQQYRINLRLNLGVFFIPRRTGFL